MEKPLGCFFQDPSPYNQTARQPEKQLFLYPCGESSGLRNSKKISVNSNHSYHSIHLAKPVSTDLTIKSNSVLTTQIGKRRLQGWWM